MVFCKKSPQLKYTHQSPLRFELYSDLHIERREKECTNKYFLTFIL